MEEKWSSRLLIDINTGKEMSSSSFALFSAVVLKCKEPYG